MATNNTRKPLTKKVRFDVFKRDGFCCAYCGSKPPTVVLEVDHITPVSAGGSNCLDNLITSCFDCNRGKGANELSVAPDSIQRRAELLAEKTEQIKAYDRLIKSNKRREEKKIDEIEEIFRQSFGGYFSDSFRASVRSFVRSMPFEDVESAMFRACSKRKDSGSDALKYFCGICWNIIKERK